MHFALKEHADKHGALLGREHGDRVRYALEREIARTADRSPDLPVALDFRGVKSVSVPFAEGLLVPLLAGRLTGYYHEHPFLVVAANEDVSETLAAAIGRQGLSVLGVVRDEPQLLGGERGLRETVPVAAQLDEFTVADLAVALGVSQQTANERLRSLYRAGAVGRKRTTPKSGGREFIYWIPDGAGASRTEPGTRAARTRPRDKRPLPA